MLAPIRIWVGKKEITPQEEAFPQFKKINLLSHPQADYLQRSILRDLVAEGHIADRTTQEEFLSKLEYITSDQAKELKQRVIGSSPIVSTIWSGSSVG